MDQNGNGGRARRAIGSRKSSGTQRTIRAGLAVVLIAWLLPGCGADAKPSAAKRAKSAAKNASASRDAGHSVTSRPKSPPREPDDAFSSLDAAIESLKTAAKASDTEGFVRAEEWIVRQGRAGVEPLGKILNDPLAEMEHRIAVCRTLRRLGPRAKAPFKQALGDESKQIQLNAIKSLGLIEPTDADIIRTLVGHVNDKNDVRTRMEAIFALANIGAPAKDAVGAKLVGMLNDPNEDEVIRGAARRALDTVDPRRTLLDR
jgi:hypothetical protein